MNKKLISLLITGAMLTSASAAFAADTEIMPAAETTAEQTAEDKAVVNQYIGEVKSVDKNIVTVAVVTDDGEYQAAFGISDNTPVYDINGNEVKAVKEGDSVIVLSTALLLTRDIKPVNAIIINNEDVTGTVYYDTFSKSEMGFISSDGELILNIDEEQQEEYDGKTLLVFYDIVTLSLPAQTNPTAIAVVETEEEDIVEENKKVSISFKIGDSILSINGNDVEVETPYVAVEGVVLVPLRVISEAFGADVDWDGDTKTVSIGYGDKAVKLQIDNKTVSVNDEENTLEEAPQLTENGFTMIPLRFISETFGAEVSYDEETKGITVELN